MANRLASATSPYLLQHADNPVDWWEWGEDAFAAARERGVPVLLSVGYAACHWCHVMAHESFEDDQLATMINERFVSIKVDREERPDVDAVYMQATQAMTGQGGWPMTVFLTPAGDPFYAGTYFPPAPSHGMPAFGQVLEAVAEAWQHRADEVRTSAAEISRRLSDATVSDFGAEVGAVEVTAAVTALEDDYDRANGGFGGAPKFPPSMVIGALLRIADSWPDDQVRESAARMAHGSLQAMAESGMYDQLAGGFARYSVDAGWVVPHFEKMLYDNGLLLGCYLHGWRSTEDHDQYRQVIIDTSTWLINEMTTDEGAFAASLDADSRGPDGQRSEGAFYLWTPELIRRAVGDDEADWVLDHGRITEAGTADGGRSTLQLKGVTDDDHDRWRVLRARLAAARDVRPRPDRDDKVIAGWNGLAIDALTEAGALLDRPEWVSAATKAAETIWRVQWVDGRLRRTSRHGVVGPSEGSAEDYALLALAFLRLAEVTADPRQAERARLLIDVLTARFSAPDGGFFDTSDDAETLISRPKDPTDNASPSGLSAAVHALTRLATYDADGDHVQRAQAAARSAGKLITAAPRFAGWLLADAVTRATRAAVEVAVVGDPDDQQVRRMSRLARSLAPAGSVIIAGSPDTAGIPLLADRTMIDDLPTAYVCRGFVCRLPVTAEDALAAQLRSGAQAV